MSKKMRFLGGSSINAQISKALRSGQEEAGQLHIEMVPIARIEPDPDNPRRTGLTRGDLDGIPAEDPEANRKQAILDKLQGLAASIKANGVQQPIKVHRHGDKFRIVYGERRYLAAVLAGQESIPAWILPERPNNTRLVQYVENVQRDDLAPWERLENVRGILDELERHEGVQGSPAVLAERTGVTERQANTYFALLNGPDDVKAALAAGTINSLEKGAYLAGIRSAPRRQAAMEACAAGATLEELRRLGQLPKPAVPAPAAKRVGRPATKINLGTTTQSTVVRQIIEHMAGQGAYAETDWDDFRAVTTTWKRFLRDLEGSVG